LRRGELALWAQRWATGVVVGCLGVALTPQIDWARQILSGLRGGFWQPSEDC